LDLFRAWQRETFIAVNYPQGYQLVWSSWFAYS
jgi:hypothetical protein